MKIIQMGWIYDINTGRALQLVRERMYLQGIYSTLPSTRRINYLYTQMDSYLNERLKGEHYA